VTAIANFTTQVVDASLSATRRSQALMFLDHVSAFLFALLELSIYTRNDQFIGDIGQPLHVEAAGLGGNDFSVRCAGSSTNLHSVWGQIFFSFVQEEWR
jgi:hypothetical protein